MYMQQSKEMVFKFYIWKWKKEQRSDGEKESFHGRERLGKTLQNTYYALKPCSFGEKLTRERGLPSPASQLIRVVYMRKKLFLWPETKEFAHALNAQKQRTSMLCVSLFSFDVQRKPAHPCTFQVSQLPTVYKAIKKLIQLQAPHTWTDSFKLSINRASIEDK